jgi:hypothetical protein
MKLLTRLYIASSVLFAVMIIGASHAHATEFKNPLKHSPYLQLGNAPLVGYGDSAHDQFEILWQSETNASGTNTDTFSAAYKLISTSTWTAAPAESTLDTNIDVGATGTRRINHFLTITGLQYDTDYDYRVLHIRNGSTLATYTATYHTRIAPGSTTSFTFATYGDSGSNDAGGCDFTI